MKLDLEAIQSNLETSSTGNRAMLAVKYIPALIAEVERLNRASHKAWSLLKKVLDDEESRPGGWGPDITMLRFISEAQAALDE